VREQKESDPLRSDRARLGPRERRSTGTPLPRREGRTQNESRGGRKRHDRMV